MISVLFTREKSAYDILGLDTWPESRNALNFKGTNPVICHPPCRAWGKLKRFSKHGPGEKDLARFAVKVVRANGGVLEHPVGSTLFVDQRLPLVDGLPDEYGGFTVSVDQCDFGHRARKQTLLYCVGVDRDLAYARPPPRSPVHPVEHMGRPERERTPLLFAEYLVALAQTAFI